MIRHGRGRDSCPWQAKAPQAQAEAQQVWDSSDGPCGLGMQGRAGRSKLNQTQTQGRDH